MLTDFFEGRVGKVFNEIEVYRGARRALPQALCRFQDAVDYGNAHGWGIPQVWDPERVAGPDPESLAG